MSRIGGAVATVVFVDDDHGLVWARYRNGNAGSLNPDDGRAVSVGSVVLVLFAYASFFKAPAEVFPKNAEVGSVATVVLAAAGEPYWVRFTGGDFGPLHRDGGRKHSVGAVLLVSSLRFTLAPDQLMPPRETGIGVARRVEETRSLVETDASMRWLPHEGAVSGDRCLGAVHPFIRHRAVRLALREGVCV